jgi:glycosyltransferase involved in cell wall biosynthesis
MPSEKRFLSLGWSLCLDISVVVPIYNRAPYLIPCIEALIHQDFPKERYELIFVDNGSTDSSLEILRSFPELRVFCEARRGSYHARNLGLTAARGAWIAFTDGDCAPDLNWLASIADSRQESHVVQLGLRRFASGSRQLRLISDYEEARDRWTLTSSIPEVYYGYTNNMAVRRDLFTELGSFQGVSRGGDTVFVQKVLSQFGLSSVQYNQSMGVTHLELDDLRTYYLKCFLYGRSSRRNRSLAPTMRPLSGTERLEVLREAVGSRGPSHEALLLTLLAPGLAAFNVGRLVGSVS